MKKNWANIITFSRTLLTGIIFLLLLRNFYAQILATILIPIVMAMDMLDGIVARKTQSYSINGGVYDILADRMIEFAFFIFFSSFHVCSFWAALIIVWRGLVLDTLRGIALRQGKTAFGDTSMHQAIWAKVLTCSRLSRATYNTLKTLAFILMAIKLYLPVSNVMINSVVWFTVIWSLLRAIPVFVDSWRLVKA